MKINEIFLIKYNLTLKKWMGEENKYLNIYFIYTVIASIVASVVSINVTSIDAFSPMLIYNR